MTANKRTRKSPRRARRRPTGRRSSLSKGAKPKESTPQLPFQPRVNRALKGILESIGVPQAKPFVPDPFQIESIEQLKQNDVVVSAPTGSGKTWIAVKAIEQALANGQRAWYASPLKALSNSKYAEFGEIFGPERVGILTGDRKENSGAPLIVGTTEILRNQLYDAMHRGEDLDSGLVVLDEAHYLGDVERGVVWEEVIIYLPPRVRLLLLSATVENADQIARWLTFVRDESCRTVITDERPVPLYPVFLMSDGELTPLKAGHRLFPKVRHFLEQDTHRHPPGFFSKLPPVGRILRAMEFADLLPAIFFLKSRADCDAALVMSKGANLRIEADQHQALVAEVDDFVARFPFVEGHPHLEYLLENHVAAHHAGHLPHWKLLVERLMQKGLLRAIFSTSTVAAGVNFPARTVVVTQSDRFNGKEFVELSATDLLQMTGRAGRRGMDKIGFCLTVPGPFNNLPLVASLMDSTPEPIQSQISINFSMVLNLLLSQRPAEVKQLLGLSLATFQRLEETRSHREEDLGLQRELKSLARELTGSACPGPEEAVVRRRRQRQLKRLAERLGRELEFITQRPGLWGSLTRGRVIMDMFGSLAAVLRREEGDEPGVLTVSLEEDRRLARGKPRLDFVPLGEVAGLFREVLNLPQSGGGRTLARAVLDQIPDNPTPLPPAEKAELGGLEIEHTREKLAAVEEELAGLECVRCALRDDCLTPKSGLYQNLERAEKMLARVQEQSHAFWFDFVRHLEFLRAESFVDPEGRLTQDGLWASKLRLDQPVLIAEAIRQGALPNDDPVLLAGLVALFVDDRERDIETPYLSERLKNGLAGLRQSIEGISRRLKQWGFNLPPMPLPAAAAVFAWSLDTGFEDVVSIYGGAEGDMAQLIYRTSDNLRQIISLGESHPRLAATAKEAVELLLRPPVVVPT